MQYEATISIYNITNSKFEELWNYYNEICGRRDDTWEEDMVYEKMMRLFKKVKREKEDVRWRKEGMEVWRRYYEEVF